MEKCVAYGREMPSEKLITKIRTSGTRAYVEYYCPVCLQKEKLTERNIKADKHKDAIPKITGKMPEIEQCSVCGEMFNYTDIKIRVSAEGLKARLTRYCPTCYQELLRIESQEK